MFVSAEVDVDFLEELVELRDALSAIKRHAEDHANGSVAAAKSLAKLSTSLGVLRALTINRTVKT